jgi:hypothetical protein
MNYREKSVHWSKKEYPSIYSAPKPWFLLAWHILFPIIFLKKKKEICLSEENFISGITHDVNIYAHEESNEKTDISINMWTFYNLAHLTCFNTCNYLFFSWIFDAFPLELTRQNET